MKLQFGSLEAAVEEQQDAEEIPKSRVSSANVGISERDIMMADVMESPKWLGVIEQGVNKHFYTRGAFDLVQLVIYILRQTGPADVVISSYSVAEDTLNTLHRMVEAGKITSIRFLIDNRVRSISPKPFDVMVNLFPGKYKCLSLHAKIALIGNKDWKISVIGSQNATHNPKLERGIIHTDPRVFTFDKERLDDEFEQGTT